MSQISSLPLPSISLVLTTDHTRIPRRPSVVEVAPLPLPPIELYTSPFGPMCTFTRKTIHSRDFEARPVGEERFSQEKYSNSQHVVFVEEVESEDFTLAESIYEDRANGERVGIGKAVKRKMSRALVSFRQVFCVELPYMCLCRRRRK